jgi:hypothetical protein
VPSYSMAPDNGRVNRVARYIINPDTGPIPCCWDTCDRRALTIWPLRTHEHPPHWPCDHPYAQHSHYTFCCDQHRRYWLLSSGWRAHETAARNNGQIYGYLWPGEKIGRFR